jgi:hypothetical protein
MVVAHATRRVGNNIERPGSVYEEKEKQTDH